jgi:hypothetical protein
VLRWNHTRIILNADGARTKKKNKRVAGSNAGWEDWDRASSVSLVDLRSSSTLSLPAETTSEVTCQTLADFTWFEEMEAWRENQFKSTSIQWCYHDNTRRDFRTALAKSNENNNITYRPLHHRAFSFNINLEGGRPQHMIHLRYRSWRVLVLVWWLIVPRLSKGTRVSGKVHPTVQQQDISPLPVQCSGTVSPPMRNLLDKNV